MPTVVNDGIETSVKFEGGEISDLIGHLRPHETISVQVAQWIGVLEGVVAENECMMEEEDEGECTTITTPQEPEFAIRLKLGGA